MSFRADAGCQCEIYQFCEKCNPELYAKAVEDDRQRRENYENEIKSLTYERSASMPERLRDIIFELSQHAPLFVAQACAHTLGREEQIQALALLHRARRNLDPLAQEGYRAGLEGADKTDNPYPEGGDGYLAWLRGWEEANGI